MSKNLLKNKIKIKMENGKGTERSQEYIRISVQMKVPNEEVEKRPIGSFLSSYTGSRRFIVRLFGGGGGGGGGISLFVCFEERETYLFTL